MQHQIESSLLSWFKTQDNMLCFTFLFVFILPILAHSDHGPELHEGACPKPPAAEENLDSSKFIGTWIAISSNCETQIITKTRKDCVQHKVEADGSDFLVTSHFRNQSSDNNVLRRKFRPIEGQPGRFSAQLQVADGSYVDINWIFTLVRSEGDSILQYGCGEKDGHHSSFYRIFSRKIPARQEEIDLLLQQVKDNGDKREFVLHNQENCQYTLK